jgi:hypothetical protein
VLIDAARQFSLHLRVHQVDQAESTLSNSGCVRRLDSRLRVNDEVLFDIALMTSIRSATYGKATP